VDMGAGRGERTLQTDLDAVRVGLAAAARILRRSPRWWHEAEDVRADAALGALEAWRRHPEAHAGYLTTAAMNAVFVPRTVRKEASMVVAEVVDDVRTTDPWPQCEAAMDVGRLAEGLTERRLAAIREEGGGRADPAHYAARCRALNDMRARAA
jgi:hypothetical protein